MSDSPTEGPPWRLLRSVSGLAAASGIGFGCYMVYASLAGAPRVPFVDGALWTVFGVLTVAQSVRYLIP